MKQRIETQRRKAYVIRLTTVQLIVALAGMLAAYPVAGTAGVLSVISGVLVALLPQAFFIQRLGILRSRRRPSSAVNLFRAEAGKFGLTVALFSAVFVVVPPSNPAFFFSAYVAVVLMHGLTPLFMRRHRTLD
ncbi:ATP synthase subunit I [Vreelandella nanhaiensis]|uniref:F0F1 ATP synthase assembly protein I n=1 Tax=Vreelandella nanhaiensis TaxID=1258546 RepID=A0A433KND2_9GAMM|nr:ATP synthase subunit I [Halomonas nanhaiensis]RUR31118.1 F0F1 ATP synthase assembly protein I [Halomonas nanhaiensis]